MNPARPKNPARPRSTWLGRLLRGLRLDRNPLRRGSDRAETAMLGVLLAAFLAGVPFAAHAAGSWIYAASVREAHAQQAALHQVPATLLQAAAPLGAGGYGSEADARWRAPDGHASTGQVFVPAGTPAGNTVMVWVNRVGQLTDPPLQHNQVMGRTVIARVFAVTALAVVLIIVGWAARWALDRRRLAAWEAEWLASGPRWSPRR
ncbi:MAG: Rv1733c family protein [Streptosporangiaceae bacterium]